MGTHDVNFIYHAPELKPVLNAQKADLPVIIIENDIGIGLDGNELCHEIEVFDKLHYRTENKLLSLVKALQSKRKEGSWDQEIHDTSGKYVT